MTGGVTRRFVLGGAGAAIASAAMAEAPLTSLVPPARPAALAGGAAELVAAPARASAPDPDSLIAAARLGGAVGYVVADAKSGQVLESHAPDIALPPASVTKTVTTAYALTTLGSEHRFATRLIATGPIAGDTLDGDLVLAGGGDPVLDTDALAEMVAQLKATGIRKITGKYRVWAGALPYVRAIDPAQPPHVGYNPAVSGLNLNFNRVYFQWQRAQNGWAVSMDARSRTLRPAVTTARMRVVNRKAPTYTYHQKDGVDEWSVAAAALGKGGSRWLPVRRPDLYAAEVLQVIAASHGIRLPKADPVNALPGGTVVAAHRSETLDAIVRDMLKYSTNMVAESIGLAATEARGGHPGGLKASARAMSNWMRSTYGASAARFEDHSGLGGDNRVSPGDLVRMLVKLGPGGLLDSRMKEVPVWTAEGKTDQSPRYRIQAKTGTLNFVSALSGYVTAPDQTPLAFAVLTADTARRDSLAPDEMERPEGGHAWTRRSRLLQQQLVRRWATLYGA